MIYRIAGCRIQISFLCIAVLTIGLFLDRNGMIGYGILAALLHECGHLCMILLCGRKIKGIRLAVFGAEIQQSQEGSFGFQKDILVSAAGPAINLIVGLLLFFVEGADSSFMWANLFLGIANLIPAAALDGGEIVYSLLCLRLKEEKAVNIVEILSFLVLTPIAVLGFLLLFRSAYNFSLLFFAVYGMVFLVVKRKKER